MKTKIYAEEIIGKTIRVVASKNKEDEGISGKILDETKNTIIIKTSRGEKRLFKNKITLEIGGKIVEGKQLLKRPEERIK